MDFSTEVRNRLSNVDLDEALLTYEVVADEIAYRLQKLVPLAAKYFLDKDGDIYTIQAMRSFCEDTQIEVTEEIFAELDSIVENSLYTMYRHHLADVRDIVQGSFDDCKDTNLVRMVFAFVGTLEDIHGRDYIANL